MNIKDKIKSLSNRFYRMAALPILEANNEILLRKTSRLLSIALLHQQNFSKFKGCNMGRSVVLVGAGPSLDSFKPIDNAIYVGLNSAVAYSNVKFDYLFMIDKIGIKNVLSEICAYDCIKFVGDQNRGPDWQIPESIIAQMKGTVYRYKTDVGLYKNSMFTLDIDSQPLGNFNSVSLQALQFILYTNPAKIYLVGIDCTTAGHFGNHDTLQEYKSNLQKRGANISKWARNTTIAWEQAKDYISQYYPDTQIISVNPVGLKGLFTDLVQ